MADYSNLFRGGGVSQAGRPKVKKGKNRILIFIILCCVALISIWLYQKVSGSSDTKKMAEVEFVEEAKPLTSTPITIPIETKTTEVKKVAQKLSISPKTLLEVKEDLEKAKEAINKDEFVAAKNYALKILGSGLNEGDEYWEKAADILGEANTGIYINDVPAPNKKLYTIQDGDSLIRIAKRFKTTVEAIQKSNSLDPTNPTIFPGKTLYIYTGEWTVQISKSKFRLYLFDGKDLFKIYRIGIGKQGRTPIGIFEISTKQKEPIWYNEGKAIPYGSKDNVLGTRWMALKPIGETNKNLRGYGIHGTWQPETVGTKSSNGCIRMKNEEVDELFSILPYHTEVVIKK